MADVVVSYGSADRPAAAFIVSMLQAAGFDVWWDARLEAGSSYDTAIVDTISTARCVVVIWSSASVVSDWVRGEATLAIQQNKFVPVRLDGVTLPPPFSMRQTVDLSTWRGHPLHPEWWDVIGAVRGKVDPSRKTAMAPKVYEHTAISSSGHYIHKIKAKDTSGRWCYYFVLVPPFHERRLLRELEGDGIVDLEQCGMVIASNYGEEPTNEIKQFLRDRYAFAV